MALVGLRAYEETEDKKINTHLSNISEQLKIHYLT